jgi:PAS domain S-box-containing protein
MGYREGEEPVIDEKMRHPQDRLRLILDGSDIIVWAMNSEGIFSVSEGRGLHQIGQSPGEVVGQSVFELYREDAGALAEVKRCLAGEDFASAQQVADRIWQTTFRFLRDESGQPCGASGVSVDITDRIAAETALQSAHDELEQQVAQRTQELVRANDELRQEIKARKIAEEEQRQLSDRLQAAERLESLGKLAGGVAHDFNNRLVSILGFAEMIAKDATVEKHRQYATRIVRGAERAARLTEQILAFARQGAFQSVILDLHELMGEAQTSLTTAMGADIQISTALNANPSTVRGDPSQLEDVFINLMINAREAMPDGGQLILESETVTVEDDSRIGTLFEDSSQRYIRFTVSDTGRGIDPEIQKRIFDPFFTTKDPSQGTGMGLASVYGTINNHGGQICVESIPGSGAAFIAYLPVCT